MTNIMLIVFNKRMIVAYTEDLMIMLATLLKIAWVMEFDSKFDKTDFSVYKNTGCSNSICTKTNAY